jgi:hypothetical protein
MAHDIYYRLLSLGMTLGMTLRMTRMFAWDDMDVFLNTDDADDADFSAFGRFFSLSLSSEKSPAESLRENQR